MAIPPANNYDLTGTKVEDYEVVARLGGGGMGVVYEGRSPDGKRVAIKTLKVQLANDDELVGRFLGEARALKAISHKAMVEILSIGQLDDGTRYMVMEFLEGRTFEEVIENGAPLDPVEVMTWMVEILDVLEKVHEAGVIHRDLKPSNLYLARTGIGPQVKLIDFGIAKHTGKSNQGAPKTQVSAIVGTPDYMSPEQVNGTDVTAASDLYALGCVVYEMLTGYLPFEEESSVRKMLSHVERPAPRVSARVKTVPRGLDDTVAWMMEKDPKDRPPSARALKERFSSLLRGRAPMPTLELPIPDLRGDERATEVFSQKTLMSPKPNVTEPSVPVITEPEREEQSATVAMTSAAAAPEGSTSKGVRIRRARTEPVERPTSGRLVPMWLVLVGGAFALGLATIVTWRLLRTPTVVSVGPPLASPVAPPPAQPATAVETPPTVTEPVKPAPPDRPIPKRKKTAAPTRKKPAGGKRR